MVPKLVIMAVGSTTQVFLEGRQIGSGVEDLVYSARDKDGSLNPTLKLLEVDINRFSFEKGKDIRDFMDDIGNMREMVVEAEREAELSK